jgi:predicted ATP-grasp superfamily ATP-dependent carboligase
MKINYGIIAWEESDDPEMYNVLHFVGYENPPTNNDFLSLTDELITDPEFDLVGRIGVDVFLKEAPKYIVEDMAKRIGDW